LQDEDTEENALNLKKKIDYFTQIYNYLGNKEIIYKDSDFEKVNLKTSI
jgi:hypothetical protein